MSDFAKIAGFEDRSFGRHEFDFDRNGLGDAEKRLFRDLDSNGDTRLVPGEGPAVCGADEQCQRQYVDALVRLKDHGKAFIARAYETQEKRAKLDGSEPDGLLDRVARSAEASKARASELSDASRARQVLNVTAALAEPTAFVPTLRPKAAKVLADALYNRAVADEIHGDCKARAHAAIGFATAAAAYRLEDREQLSASLAALNEGSRCVTAKKK